MATSQAQFHANQANAQFSTGPRSDAGKERSARNAASHGLSGSALTILPQEAREDYAALFNTYAAEFHPRTEHEAFLVGQMVHARWRLNRIQRLELRYSSGDYADDAGILARMSTRSADPFVSLQRYAAAAERSYYRAHRELQAARKPKPVPKPAAAKISSKTVAHPYSLPRQPWKSTAPVQNEPNPAANLALRL